MLNSTEPIGSAGLPSQFKYAAVTFANTIVLENGTIHSTVSPLATVMLALSGSSDAGHVIVCVLGVSQFGGVVNVEVCVVVEYSEVVKEVVVLSDEVIEVVVLRDVVTVVLCDVVTVVVLLPEEVAVLVLVCVVVGVVTGVHPGASSSPVPQFGTPPLQYSAAGMQSPPRQR